MFTALEQYNVLKCLYDKFLNTLSIGFVFFWLFVLMGCRQWC